jgi:hypothetical protein
MKAWSIIGLLFAAGILATVPVSPQVTPRGNLELTIDKAEAYTYGRARRITRRTYRRGYRYARRSAYYGAPSYYGYGPSVGYGGYGYGAPAMAMADMVTVALALDSVSASGAVIKPRV